MDVWHGYEHHCNWTLLGRRPLLAQDSYKKMCPLEHESTIEVDVITAAMLQNKVIIYTQCCAHELSHNYNAMICETHNVMELWNNTEGILKQMQVYIQMQFVILAFPQYFSRYTHSIISTL